MSDPCDLLDYSLPVSSVHGISQESLLEWIAISFSIRTKKDIYYEDWLMSAHAVIEVGKSKILRSPVLHQTFVPEPEPVPQKSSGKIILSFRRKVSLWFYSGLQLIGQSPLT